MNNSTTSIAFSIYSNKGVYALFLGSGISKPSGIPTGWDIVIDLINKLAALNNEKLCNSPEEWFKSKYGVEPNYSNLLSKLVKSSSERVNFLRPYFEPTKEEIEQGLKIPKAAHRAIARLVKGGLIKVIITTNFDRLLEKALNESGIEPVVIRHPDDIDGTEPVTHSDFILIKINGDYLDSRFLNTEEELSSYNKKMHDYLHRIVSEFGLLSCGWSAKWDTGFVNILRKCENYRYYSYWSYVGKCEKELKEISDFRKGETVKIDSADTFFTEITDKIEALKSLNDNHPLNADIAVARLKNYIVKEDSKILLHDLLFTEQEVVYNKINQRTDISLYPDSKNLMPVLTDYIQSLETMIPLIINGVFWSKPEHHFLFTNILSRISEPAPHVHSSKYDATESFHHIPALIILYAIGISALKRSNFELIFDCFRLKIDENDSDYSDQYFLIDKIHSCMVDSKIMNEILEQNYKTPISTYLCNILKPYFSNHILSNKEYNDIFDLFEYILSLNYVHIIGEKYGHIWAPWGQFHWRKRGVIIGKRNMLIDFLDEAEKMKSNWDVLKSGMFDGDFEIFIKAKSNLDGFLQKIPLY